MSTRAGTAHGGAGPKHPQTPDEEIPQDPPSKMRLTLDLTPSFHRTIDEIQDLVGAGNKAEVVRQSLLLYRLLIQAVGEGWKVQLARESAGQRELKELALFTVAKTS